METEARLIRILEQAEHALKIANTRASVVSAMNRLMAARKAINYFNHRL